MVSYADIKEIEACFTNKDSINIIKTTIYIVITFIILYIYLFHLD